jgi:hypothetical protein
MLLIFAYNRPSTPFIWRSPLVVFLAGDDNHAAQDGNSHGCCAAAGEFARYPSICVVKDIAAIHPHVAAVNHVVRSIRLSSQRRKDNASSDPPW